MRVYERMLWPALRRMDPERAHALALAFITVTQRVPPALWLVGRLGRVHDARLAVSWRGLTFPNPIGLAAGFDKDARAMRFFEAAGFGFVEVGTVTPEPQSGNPRPRLFRDVERKALVNSLGFPGQGVARVGSRLVQSERARIPIGVNIGKNARTPLEDAWRDYSACLEALYRCGDYFTVNVSSPNTAGLTSLQARPALAAILQPLARMRRNLSVAEGRPPKPLLVKISPDLTEDDIDGVVDIALEHGIDGLIATNTSTDPELKGAMKDVRGGISGAPLHARAVETVRHIRGRVPGDFLLIGAGGVFDAGDAWDFLEAGANLVQLYTGMIYRGPGIAAAVSRGLASMIGQSGLPSFAAMGKGTGSTP